MSNELLLNVHINVNNLISLTLRFSLQYQNSNHLFTAPPLISCDLLELSSK